MTATVGQPQSRREFHKLLSASLLSQIGSHLLTLALAAYVMLETGDAVDAALIFVFSFLPASLVSKWAGAFVDRHLSKRLLVLTDLAAMGVSAGCGIAVAEGAPLALVASLLAGRSILMFLQRSAMTKWLKTISAPAEQVDRFQLMLLGFFISTAVSGLIAAVALGSLGIMGALAIDLATYAVGLAVIATLEPVASSVAVPKGAGEGRSVIQLLRGNPLLWTAFVCVVGTQALFQGAYSVLVTYLPMKIFAMGSHGTGYFQLAASLGILAGFAVNRRWPAWLLSDGMRHARLAPVLLLTGACIVAAGSLPLPAALIAFFAINALYEAVWLAASSYTFKAVPVSVIAEFQYVQASVGAMAMSFATLAYAVAIRQSASTNAVVETAAVVVAGLALIGISMAAPLLGRTTLVKREDD